MNMEEYMNKEYAGRHATHFVLWLTLVAAVGSAGCRGDQQTQAEPAPEPAAGASAVHGAPAASEAPHSTAREAMEVGYACADDKAFTIAFSGSDEIQITIDGETHTLTRTSGHTGLLFSNDDIVFYSQGREGSVEIGGVPTFTDCEAQGHPSSQ